MAKTLRNQSPARQGFTAPLPLLHSRKRQREQAGIQSLEAGLDVLKRMIGAARPMKLRDIAAATGMSPSKAHRYLVSLCRSGLIAQGPGDAEYRLGPYALEMAVACLNSLRPV